MASITFLASRSCRGSSREESSLNSLGIAGAIGPGNLKLVRILRQPWSYLGNHH